jgi:dihydrodipicolinate synthase/N-acetylneuraminate lyase
MVSPFCVDRSVDVMAAKTIASKLVSEGTIPFVLGSTGEGPSLPLLHKVELVKSVAEVTNGKLPLYAGLSPNSFDAAIEEATLFAENGATVLVITLPYYFPVNEQQMTCYFEQLADALPLPLFLYNMPGMVKKSIPLDVAEKLSHHPNIVGMKDSERDEARLANSISMWKDRTDFSFLIGWAAKSSQGLQMGADGIVPSTGNICPELYKQLFEAVQKGNFSFANELQEKTNYISSLYQKDRDLSHSIPALKVMMSVKGLCSAEVLPPMYKMDDYEEEKYKQTINEEFRRLNF